LWKHIISYLETEEFTWLNNAHWEREKENPDFAFAATFSSPALKTECAGKLVSGARMSFLTPFRKVAGW